MVRAADDSAFPWGTGLPAARALVQLAEVLESSNRQIAAATEHALVDFVGPVADTFRSRRDDDHASAVRVAARLRELADGIAANWARERGNQDRTNFGRWRDAQIAHDNWMENLFEWFVGEDDYGPPPEDPPIPCGPGYGETRWPMYSAYGP